MLVSTRKGLVAFFFTCFVSSFLFMLCLLGSNDQSLSALFSRDWMYYWFIGVTIGFNMGVVAFFAIHSHFEVGEPIEKQHIYPPVMYAPPLLKHKSNKHQGK